MKLKCILFIIKRTVRCAKSGYYWIKPKCAESALKGYCDFNYGNWNFYYFYGKKKGKKVNDFWQYSLI